MTDRCPGVVVSARFAPLRVLQVFEASTGIRERLKDIDEGIANTLIALAVPDTLVTRDHAYVLAVWDDIQARSTARRNEIVKFGVTLDALEDEKVCGCPLWRPSPWCRHAVAVQGAGLAAAVSKLVGELIETAHLLPPAIERLAEREVMDVNRVTLKNRRDFADLIARMEKTHVSMHFANRRCVGIACCALQSLTGACTLQEVGGRRVPMAPPSPRGRADQVHNRD